MSFLRKSRNRNPAMFAVLLAFSLLVTSMAPLICCHASAAVTVQAKQSAPAVSAQTPQDDCGCLCAGDHCTCNHAGSIGNMAEYAANAAARVSFTVAGLSHAPPPLIPQSELLRPPRA
jgi:hypothetical protein